MAAFNFIFRQLNDVSRFGGLNAKTSITSALLAALFLVLGDTANAAGVETHIQRCGNMEVAVANDLRIVCSATWQLEGVCSGEDLWDKWKVRGQTNPDNAFIRPWLDTSITVIGYELVKLHPDHSDPKINRTNERMSWFMIGSGIVPQGDAMLWLAPGNNYAKQMWPAGMGQIWPSKDEARKPNEDILDVHGSCIGGGSVTVILTLYYTPSSLPPIRK